MAKSVKKESSVDVLLLHGWGLSGKRWKKMSDQLSRLGYKTHAPDFPGFGDQPEPDLPYSMPEYVRYLETYIKVNDIRKPVIIGHSFGGRVALVYASIHQSSVSALVLSGVPGYRPISKKRYIIARIGGFLGKILVHWTPLRFVEEPIRSLYYRIVGARDYSRASATMRKTFKEVVSYSLESAMKQITIPTMLVWGEKDNVVPRFVPERMASTIQRANLVFIPNAGHNVIVDSPELCLPYIQAFLKH